MRTRFGGGRERVLARDHYLSRVCQASALVPVSPAPLVELVLDSLASPHFRRAYHRALREFFSATARTFSSATAGMRQTLPARALPGQHFLSAASINLAMAVLRKLAAGIRGVPGARRSGVRTGNWLTLPQAQQLLAEPDPETTKGLRDRVLLGLLVGCGLRRGELAGLEFRDVAQREGRWAIVDLVGKHGRVRTVPMQSWAKTALDGWAASAGLESGAVLRRVSKGGKVVDVERLRRGRLAGKERWKPVPGRASLGGWGPRSAGSVHPFTPTCPPRGALSRHRAAFVLGASVLDRNVSCHTRPLSCCPLVRFPG